MSTKTCSSPICSQINPQTLDSFHKDSRRIDGLMLQCKTCRKKTAKEYHKTRDGFNTYLKWRYGITEKQYDIMLDLQNHRCTLCQRHRNEFKHRFSVDHDHKTGRVRSLLCGPCNQALGLLKDNPDLCRRASDYLIHHFEPPIPYSVHLKGNVWVHEDRDDHLPSLADTLTDQNNIP